MRYEIILMKYVIILYLCSFVNVQPVCFTEKIVGLEFDNYPDCILEGYRQSYSHLQSFGKDKINEEKLAIKFICKEINIEKKEV